MPTVKVQHEAEGAFGSGALEPGSGCAERVLCQISPVLDGAHAASHPAIGKQTGSHVESPMTLRATPFERDNPASEHLLKQAG